MLIRYGSITVGVYNVELDPGMHNHKFVGIFFESTAY
jgi:hypothetical protein